MFDFGGLFGISKRDISKDIKEYDPNVQNDCDKQFLSEVTEWKIGRASCRERV